MKHLRIVIAALASHVSLVLLADVPDLTSALEFIDNPATNRWPANSYARGVLDLQFYRGRLFNGGGEVESNPGPTWIHSIDPYTNETRFEYSAGTEAIANYLVSSWGDLLSPSQDPHEGDATEGHIYQRTAEGAWSVLKPIGGSLPAGSSTVANKTHCWHMAEFDGRVFMASYNLLSSTDRCKTFQVCSPITNAYHSIRRASSASGTGKRRTYTYGTTSTLRRQIHFLRFENELFALGNTIVNPSLWSDNNVNNQELYRYDATTKQFVETSQHLRTIYPALTPSDYKLVGRNYDYIATNDCAYIWMRTWHPTSFKGRVLYVACYDTPPYSSKVAPFEDSIALTSYPLPLMGCSATVASGKIAATRLSFGGDTENYPWDFAVYGNAVYALTSKYDAATKLNHHVVWKSTDGVAFSEVLSFDFHQNMISLEYRDGWFYFGAGVKSATKGYAYDKQADEAGAIYRIRCPQEPVSVVASVESDTLAEGISKTFGFKLSAAPTTNLTVKVGVRASQQVTLDRATLTFTPQNWATVQNVTATLVDDATSDDSDILLICGADSDDIERGEFASPEVTSALVTVRPIDNDLPATIATESVSATTNTAVYAVKASSLGEVGGQATSRATVSFRVYADEALTMLAGETSGTLAETGIEKRFTVTGLDRGKWYWAEARVASAPGVEHVFVQKYRSPIAAESELVDLMDDADNRVQTWSNANTGGAEGQGAYDGSLTEPGKEFGGYNRPSWLIYQFKDKRVVNGIGFKAVASGDTDQMAKTFIVYASDDYDDITNKTPANVILSTTDGNWAYGEVRRYVVTNTTAYTYYKVSIASATYWGKVSEIELYSIGTADGTEPTPGGDPDPGTDPDPGPGTAPDPDPGTDPDPGPGTDPEPDPGTDPEPDPGTDPEPVDTAALYVATNGDDSAEGTYTAPLLTITNAIARLGEAGGKVIVMPGEYRITAPIAVTSAVSIVGLSGNFADTIVKQTKSPSWNSKDQGVFKLNHPAALLGGLTITGGGVYDQGGGVRIETLGGIVSNCLVHTCYARDGSGNAGGIIIGSADGLVTHTVVSNCWINSNPSWAGFKAVSVKVSGGGRIANSLITGTQTGISDYAGASSAFLQVDKGSAVNCTVVGNTGVMASGIDVGANGSAVNCLSAGNFRKRREIEDAVTNIVTELNAVSGTAAKFVNCATDSSEPVNATCTIGTAATLFVDCANGEYTPAGAAVDAGAAVEGLPATDLAGRVRVYGLAVDIGCYEKPGAPAPAVDSVTLTEDETASGAVTVPYAWLTEQGCDCSTPEKAKAAALATGANGYAVWASYVADLNPRDPNAKFVATISVGADGVASVTWTPNSERRSYRVLGKANLTDAEWSDRTAVHRFFKVVVGLPE